MVSQDKRRLCKQKRRTKRKNRSDSRAASMDWGLDRVFELVEFGITWDPIHDPLLETLPKSDRARIEEISERFEKRPAECVEDLEALIEDVPNYPRIYNLLSVAYESRGDDDAAIRITCECYRRIPDYLFAMVNYASICLSEGRVDEAADVLKHKFALHLHYPRRRQFHVTE